MNVMDLEISNNHIAFFDKLEKSNNAYENIINIKDTSFAHLHKESIIKYCVSEGGYWEWFVAIVNKYGIVPYSYNPNAVESTNYEKIEYLYTEKVKNEITGKSDIRKINVKNFKESILYTLDGQVIQFIKVEPINIKLIKIK